MSKPNTRPEIKNRSEYASLLEYQKAKKAQLEWDIAQAENRIKAQQSKIETKKKVLIGAFVLNQIENNQINKTDFYSKLNKFLTRQSDKNLFEDELKQVPDAQN